LAQFNFFGIGKNFWIAEKFGYFHYNHHLNMYLTISVNYTF